MKGILFPAALLLTLLAFVKAEACTTAVIPASASRTGRPLLWKQRDTSEEANHLAHFRGERYAFTGLVDTADTLLESVWCGANEAGFAIANNVSYNLRPDSLENKPYEGLVMKRALGCCATVDDFERMLREMPHPNGLETNYGVIDAAGGAAYFEVWDYGYTRYDTADTPEGYLWRTNFSLSGRPDEGRGYTRYATAEETMAAEAAEKFSPEWLLDSLGRSFRNAVLGTDLMQEPLPASGLVLDVDYIPRYTTTASIVIEGVAAGEAPNSAVLWCAPGYTPCCYAIPVWVAAGDQIPAILTLPAGNPEAIEAAGKAKKSEKAGTTGAVGKKAPANATAQQLQQSLYPLDRDGGHVYLDMRRLREGILPEVRRAEALEFEEGKELDRKLRRTGFDPEAVAAYNERACERFRQYRERIIQFLQP